MTFSEFIGIRNGDIDRETGRKLTRREIYQRAIERFGGLDVVKEYVPFSVRYLREKYRDDFYFNNTDIKQWDFASGYICRNAGVIPTGRGLWFLYWEHGIDSASNAQGVCLLKEAARLMVEKEKESE